MSKTDNKDFSGVTHYTQVDVQPGGINIQHVEHLHQADILEKLGIELEVKKKGEANPEPANLEEEELCHFIHPELDEAEQKKVHNEIKNLVSRHQLRDIIIYLKGMAKEKRVLLPQSADNAYRELVRMGMPDGEKGFSLKTFYREY